MSKKILRLKDVINQTGLSRSSIYAFMQKGKFPLPIKLGERAVGWRESDIDQWIDSQAAL